jgi:hypothetical protein
VLALLVAIDLFVYLPWQFRRYHDLYGVTDRPREILEQADLHDALVIVRNDGGWRDYAVAFLMNAPTLDGDVVYASQCPPWTGQLLERFPGRAVYDFDGQTVRPFADPSLRSGLRLRACPEPAEGAGSFAEPGVGQE